MQAYSMDDTVDAKALAGMLQRLSDKDKKRMYYLIKGYVMAEDTIKPGGE